jgi:hypothetical protein
VEGSAAGSGYSTHVPRLLGQTTEAQRVKEGARASTQRRAWNEELFFAALAARSPEAEPAVRESSALSSDPEFELRYGSGSTQGSLNVYKPSIGQHCLVSILPSGKIQFAPGNLSGSASEEPAKERIGEGENRRVSRGNVRVRTSE